MFDCLSYHESIVGPAAKLHHTLLLIKWEILHINATIRLVNSRGIPLYSATLVLQLRNSDILYYLPS